MKIFALTLAAGLVASAAIAQDSTTIIRKDGVGSSTVVKERSTTDADVVVKQKTETTGSIGCESKTTSKTDAFGDTTVKKQTNC
jgi:hypothetical protein